MRYLTITEAAEALQLSVPTIKRYIYDGKIKSTKLPGGQHRVPQSEVERLLAGEAPAAAVGEPGDSPEQRLEVLERWVMELDAEVERLTSAMQVLARFCATRTEGEDAGTEAPELPAPVAHRVAVLGPGCRRCDALADLVTRVLRTAGRLDVAVERIHDLDEIASYGPIVTPALVVGDKVIPVSRIPGEAALKELLLPHLD